jgi:hypothetical protein
VESRDQRIADFFRLLEARATAKVQYRVERTRPHTLKAGDILHHSWGYEQTQCDYWQVLRVTAHGAIIQAIGSKTVEASTYEHGMADMRLPVADDFYGDPVKVRVNGFNRIAASEGRFSYGSAGVWDGRPHYCSWYA